MEKIYDEMHARIKELNTQSQNWTVEFEKVKVNILLYTNISKLIHYQLQNVKREESRQNYDHYDEKLEKLYKERDARTKGNKTESAKEFELLNRVN